MFGGAERVVSNLCNEMSKEEEVHFITFDSPENLGHISKDVHIHYCKEFKRYNIFALWRLAKLINDISPDIVHTHGAKATRIVYNIRHFIHTPFVGTKHNARRGKIFNQLSHVIAVSKEAAESIRADHVEVIYNGIAPVEVTHSEKSSSGVLHLLAIGRLDKIKGFDRLINACSKLDFPFVLEIVGEGSERDILARLIRENRLEDRVSLVGFRDDIPQRMHDADVVVMSSISEGFSLVMVEALFYANIFVSTPVSGAVEILEEQFLMPPDKIAEKLEDIHLHQEYYKEDFKVLQGRIKEQFLLKNIVKQHIDYYKQILKEQG